MLTVEQAHEILLQAIKNANGNCLSFELEAIRQIQLDAYKSGMYHAAEIIRPINDPHKRWKDSKDVINAADKLTEL